MYGAAVSAIARLVWAWRVELAAMAAVVLSVRLGMVARGLVPTVESAAFVAVTVSAWPQARRQLRTLLRRNRARRQVLRSIAAVRLPGFGGLLPIVLKVQDAPVGDVVTVRIPLGAKLTELENAAEPLAAVLGAREVRVTREPSHAGIAHISVIRRDPLANTPAVTWPNDAALELSAWSPIPVGVGEDGNPVHIALPERNVLIGGEPGAGKSAALSQLVATAALDPTAQLWLLDGKQVELATWAGCARDSAGPSIDDAVELLRTLQREMDARYGELLVNRARKVTPDMHLPLHVVVIDELAFYLTIGDRKSRAEFIDLARDLVARGRAAGMIVLAATQKPASEVVPTSLRDLFGFRWALRCSTPQASDTILGAGWASRGFNAANIDSADRGIGYLLHEGGQPVRLRAYWLDDDALSRLSSRAEALRAAHTETAAGPTGFGVAR